MVERIDRVFHENGIRCSVPVPGLTPTLAALAKAGYAMGVATSDGTAATRAAIEALGLGALSCRTSSATIRCQIQSPRPISCMPFPKRSACRPSEIVVVGDNPHDLEMARSAGAGAAIGVLTGNSDREHLAPLADAVLDSVRDLPAWLSARSS